MALRRTVNRQTRDDKFVVNKGKQAIFTPTQKEKKKTKKKKLLPVWRLAVTSWSAINPVELDPRGAITVVFLRYNNKPEKSKRKTSMIHRQYYSPKVGESSL